MLETCQTTPDRCGDDSSALREGKQKTVGIDEKVQFLGKDTVS